MDIGRSFSYIFSDPRWVTKVLIGGLMVFLAWLIIPAFILTGYFLQTVRNVMAGEANPLAEWDDIGGKLVDGLKAFVVYLGYILPGIILSLLSVAVAPRDGSGSVASGLFNCLGTIYNLVIAIAIPAAIGLYLTNANSIGAAFRFQEVIAQVQRHFGDFIVVWLLSFVTGLIAGAGFLVCLVGALFTVPYSLAISAHLWGQLLNRVRGIDTTTVPVVGTTPL